MIDQENEHQQLHNNIHIENLFAELYEALSCSDELEAEDALGFVAQAQAAWLGEDFETA